MAAPLRYPSRKINSLDDYLEIKIIKYIPPGLDVNEETLITTSSIDKIKTSNEKPLAYIQLPIPKEIVDTSTVGWGEDSLNTAEAFGADLIGGVLKSDNAASGFGEGIRRLFNGATSAGVSGAGQVATEAYTSAKLVQSLGSNTTPAALLSRATGKAVNPHMELLFNGVSLRSFSFGFDFAPRDPKEASVVKSIIRTFKKHMAAKTNGEGRGGVFISSPDIFQLTYRTGANKHKFLNTFQPMALQNISMNYTASGTYATYEDSTPVHMQMTLQFQEINPIYFEDYDDKNDIGVGY